MPHNQTIEERLYNRCIETDGGCWEFTGASDPRGYGRIFYKSYLWLAHRVSWFITYGEIPVDICVCHKCDNPSCCNPEHLFLGTHQENEADKRAKGRIVRGEKQGGSKLTREQVQDIRSALDNGTQGSILADKYKVARATISKIKYNKRWSWLESHS